MAQVFAGGQVHRGSFRADQMAITFNGNPVQGMILQQIQFNFNQQVSMLYEIGSNNIYYVGGRAQGTASIARIIGPSAVAGLLLGSFGDICNPQDLGLEVRGGCADTTPGLDTPALGGAAGVAFASGGGETYTLEDAILVGVGGSIGAQDIVFNEQLQFMFANLAHEAAIGVPPPPG